tara:strand:+ start:584 stop:772 length:189 start_codon:yes stop_codon:yes gene_type:complete
MNSAKRLQELRENGTIVPSRNYQQFRDNELPVNWGYSNNSLPKIDGPSQPFGAIDHLIYRDK